MNIYHYHPQTCEFLSAGVADESPLQAGEYLIPAHATQHQPPSVAVREVAVFGDGSQTWSVQADWRGVDLYHVETGERVVISRIGSIEQGLITEVAPTVSLPCVFDGKVWRADTVAAVQQVRVQRDGLLKDCDWTMLPDAPLTAEQQQAWRTYRQQLRDLPALETVVWPVQPL